MEGTGSARGTGGVGGGQASGTGRKQDECPSRERRGLHPDDTMDVDDGMASPGKKKKKERVLVERTGDARCKECMSCKATCLVEEVRVKK